MDGHTWKVYRYLYLYLDMHRSLSLPPLSLSIYIYMYISNSIYIYIYLHTYIHIYIWCGARRRQAVNTTNGGWGEGVDRLTRPSTIAMYVYIIYLYTYISMSGLIRFTCVAGSRAALVGCQQTRQGVRVCRWRV